ncbi:UDP-N-acetylmuramoyl-L-alanine--D-glutamate ligase [Nocardioides sp. TRM66260-LWL]|uniref:UDP-N-acetylmuramoyl-L-alanine--D-glutamate ligase n=1 Tax=Nocardioides sp. TRM66260-LWL TaxID=2874478 RepID=UPI001CC624A2|nr:UDP-N-acetylmuramoyl-L-alanine--D-glutamate ligase [Nocardioides sp. TRM66260-LWL]MBZ5734141.1 UDP-N-acetylmuramoyl-L-alanine--D-glutamate ligase [Nocardioides sp. TRM66260-LWL]
MRSEELRGRDVVVWGAGREGRAAVAELRRRGLEATVVVTGDGVPPADPSLGVVVAGADALPRLLAADVVIKSPGVPHASDEFRAVADAGVRVTSLTDLWLTENAARVLAVTGTKGKSTTSSLAHHLLRGVGVSATLVGNGGTPVTDGDAGEAEIAVTEVSSYQAADLSCSPRLAVVTSLYPEHLPWHGGYEQYVADKLNLIAHAPELVVVPDLDGVVGTEVRARIGPATRLLVPAELGLAVTDAGLAWAGVGELAASEVAVSGRHNLTNLALALAVVAVGLDLPDVRRTELLDAARTFAPLAHRLETVPSDDGRQWVDDSLATAPEAVVAALETFPDVRVCLVLGGADRGLSFEPLARYLATRSAGPAAVTVVALGPAGERWVRESGVPTAPATGFAEAMGRVCADDSEVVLLSPGAPSFDEFRDYEARSAAFRAAALSSS